MSRRKGESYLGGHTIWPLYPDWLYGSDKRKKKKRPKVLKGTKPKITSRKKRIKAVRRNIARRDGVEPTLVYEIGLLKLTNRRGAKPIADFWNSKGFELKRYVKWTPERVSEVLKSHGNAKLLVPISGGAKLETRKIKRRRRIGHTGVILKDLLS